jgi:hypothetical protein
VLLSLSAVEALVLWFMPETAALLAGALASLRPHVGVPAQASSALAQLTPVTNAPWANGGSSNWRPCGQRTDIERRNQRALASVRVAAPNTKRWYRCACGRRRHHPGHFAKAKGARVRTTVSTANVEFAQSLGADVIIDYKTQRFEDHASDLDMVFDLIDGETRERSWPLWPISTRVNKAENNDPSILEPVELAAMG